MTDVTDLNAYRKAQEPEDPLSGREVWFCACGSDEMTLCADGAIHCARCGTMMEGLEVIELNPEK